MTTTNDPDWIHEGAPVAVQHRASTDSIAVRRIQRLTPTEIVLDNGDRYRRADGYHQIKHSRGALPTELIDPNSARARAKMAKQEFEQLTNEADRLRRNELRETRNSAADYRQLLISIRDAADAAIQGIDSPIT